MGWVMFDYKFWELQFLKGILMQDIYGMPLNMFHKY